MYCEMFAIEIIDEIQAQNGDNHDSPETYQRAIRHNLMALFI